MFCKKCGKVIINEQAAKCPHCGCEIKREPAPSIGAIAYIAAISAAFPVVGLILFASHKDANQQAEKKAALIGTIIGIVLWFIVIIIAITSDSSTPWGKLGVSQSEYNRTYNGIKYGKW